VTPEGETRAVSKLSTRHLAADTNQCTTASIEKREVDVVDLGSTSTWCGLPTLARNEPLQQPVGWLSAAVLCYTRLHNLRQPFHVKPLADERAKSCR
jgi:hypothetical protein